MNVKVKKKGKNEGQLSVRILPNTPINQILDMLVQTRAFLEHLVVIPIYKDGAIDFFTSNDRAFEVIGLLEALKLELLENVHCAKCGGVIDGDEIHE